MRSTSAPLSADADAPRWSHGRFIGPGDDRVSAVLLVGGGTLVATSMWLFGQGGLWFEQPPDLSSSGWLITGLLLVAAVLSARWAARRLRSRGGEPASLWYWIARPPDGGRDYRSENRAQGTTIMVGGVAGGLFCAGTGIALNALGDRLSKDSIALLFMVSFSVMIVSIITWGRRRTQARIPSAHRVKPVSDRAATAAALAATVLAVATPLTAGLARIPIAVGDRGTGFSVGFLILMAGCVMAGTANFRLQSLARQQAAAAAATEAAPASTAG